MRKIYISPINYHHFSGWHPKLPTLVLRPPKLPLSDFLAPSVYFIPLILTEIGQKLENKGRDEAKNYECGSLRG
jgi:hypothetical protein